MHIWKGAVALPNALAGQSTNGTNLNRKLAFTARSRGGSALAAALVGTVPARNMATAAARRIRRKARADPRYAISDQHKRCDAPGTPARRDRPPARGGGDRGVRTG